ncbi:MAG: GTPase domain-containing protein, partial [Kiritimatiellia bacterium]
MEPVKFAVLGHPNEGKSSVVSTLTENEKVRISASPGETTRCTSFTIQVENEAAMEIIDTPGFQNPAATLEWFAAWKGEESQMVDAFIKAHAQDKSFHHDLEIMIPLKDRAGVLYVADASRPLREADRQEMELLRCIGLPR